MQRLSAFELYLRTGRSLVGQSALQFKFNPWHDPDDGRFTFAGQGNYFPRGAQVHAAQAPRNPRVRLGGNRGPRLWDPRTLEDAFPGLNNAPAGAIVGLADNFLDLSGPGRAMTTELAKVHAKLLVRQIQAVDSNYRLETFEPGGFPSTVDGQTNLINRLRLDRAKALYKKGELRPLQVETLRFLQGRVNEAYTDGVKLMRAGRLDVRLSAQEALGNYVDRRVRDELRDFYGGVGISIESGQPVQVNRRAYETSESRYSVPDSRVGQVAFDVSLTAKNLGSPQVRNFFRSDFQPRAVVIVRPRQLGPNSTYIITKPGAR